MARHAEPALHAVRFGDLRVVGVDEVGRGPLAGPVVAAAVRFDGSMPAGLADSKALASGRLRALDRDIRACAAVGLGWVSATEIDRCNILEAALLAMRRAVAAIDGPVDLALVDGDRAPRLECRTCTIIGGDAIEPRISAASIVAKVARDDWMCAQAGAHPGYGFERHKGYPTAAHLAALQRLGPCPLHRRSFAPVRRVIAAGVR